MLEFEYKNMIKEIRNVVITFSLIAVMLMSGTFFYSKKVFAEEESAKAIAELKQKELAAQATLQAQLHARAVAQEKLLADQELARKKAMSVPTTTIDAVVPQKSSSNFADAIAKQQAAYEAQQKAVADALAQQQADLIAQQNADALAQQIAKQKAATTKKTRVSRAS